MFVLFIYYIFFLSSKNQVHLIFWIMLLFLTIYHNHILFLITNTTTHLYLISLLKSNITHTHPINYYTTFINYKFQSLNTIFHSSHSSIPSILITISNSPFIITFITSLHYTITISNTITSNNIILFNINFITTLTLYYIFFPFTNLPFII